MTTPNGTSGPDRPSRPGGASSLGLATIVVLAISAAMVFWAGLSLGGRSSGRDADERAAIEVFTETYRRINDEFVGDTAPGDLLEGAIRGMFETLGDPYSTYMGPEEYDTIFAGINGEFEGIGARMNTEDPDGNACEPIGDGCRLHVVEVLPDSPALAAGLLGVDVVTGVDGRSLQGQTIDDAVMLIRGPRGSEVTLSLERDGQALELPITRDTIVSQDVRSAILHDGDIGYLRIDSFSSRSADDFESALRDLLDAGIDKLIVDVRDDPGGFVDAAIRISSQFLADGVVFWEEDADGQQTPNDVIGGGLATDPSVKVVVLVNDGSASASEILAGALQDAHRAELVGEPTFGKGTVQEWTQLPGENGGFRLSVAKWLTPDKSWINGTGLTPDVRVRPAGEPFLAGEVDADASEDVQLQRAITRLLGGETATPLGASPVPSPTPVPSPSPAA